MLEQMFQMSRAVKRPVAMFVDQRHSASIQAAVDAGVSAYIVDGLKKERITSILDLHFALQRVLGACKTELDQAGMRRRMRKIIDRAKGVKPDEGDSTSRRGLPHTLLRKRRCRTQGIVDIAQRVPTAQDAETSDSRLCTAISRWSTQRP